MMDPQILIFKVSYHWYQVIKSNFISSGSSITNCWYTKEEESSLSQDDFLPPSSTLSLFLVEDGDKQYNIAMKIFDENLSVRETEKLMHQMDKPEKAKKETPENDFIYRDLEDKVSKIMGTQVVIKNKNNNKGKIEIDYYSQEELERIIELLSKLK